MPSFLQDLKEGIRLDGGMRDSILRIEALPKQPPTLQSVQGRRRLILIFGGICHGS